MRSALAASFGRADPCPSSLCAAASGLQPLLAQSVASSSHNGGFATGALPRGTSAAADLTLNEPSTSGSACSSAPHPCLLHHTARRAAASPSSGAFAACSLHLPTALGPWRSSRLPGLQHAHGGQCVQPTGLHLQLRGFQTLRLKRETYTHGAPKTYVQLLQHITRAPKFKRLEHLVAQYGDKFDAVHASAALARLPKLVSAAPVTFLLLVGELIALCAVTLAQGHTLAKYMKG